MPQIDFVTFFSQIFWLLFIFISMYTILVVFVLPFFAILFKMVEKLGYLRLCFGLLAKALSTNVLRASGFVLVQELLICLLLILSNTVTELTPKVKIAGSVQLIFGGVLSLVVMSALFQKLESDLRPNTSGSEDV